jgi:hypothetical protein
MGGFQYSIEKCWSRKYMKRCGCFYGTEELRDMDVHLTEYEIRHTENSGIYAVGDGNLKGKDLPSGQ